MIRNAYGHANLRTASYGIIRLVVQVTDQVKYIIKLFVFRRLYYDNARIDIFGSSCRAPTVDRRGRLESGLGTRHDPRWWAWSCRWPISSHRSIKRRLQSCFRSAWDRRTRGCIKSHCCGTLTSKCWCMVRVWSMVPPSGTSAHAARPSHTSLHRAHERAIAIAYMYRCIEALPRNGLINDFLRRRSTSMEHTALL